MTWRIIPLSTGHLGSVVDLHLRSFPGFFLSFLGKKFLSEFYRSYVSSESSIGLIAVDESTNIVLGAVVGPLEPEGYFRRLVLRRWWAFALASLPAVVKRPAIVFRLFRAVHYRGDSPLGQSLALLSSIAVAPEAQGLGIGQELVKAWLQEVRCRGGQGAFLTTDAEANEAVNCFYQRLGWKLDCTFVTTQRRRMNRYVYDFLERP